LCRVEGLLPALAAGGAPRLLVSGVDLIDGTPVIDVKPYHPADCPLPLQMLAAPALAPADQYSQQGHPHQHLHLQYSQPRFPSWISGRFHVPSHWGTAVVSRDTASGAPAASVASGASVLQSDREHAAAAAAAAVLPLLLTPIAAVFALPSALAQLDALFSAAAAARPLEFFSLPGDAAGALLRCAAEAVAGDPRSVHTTRKYGETAVFAFEVDDVVVTFAVKDVPAAAQAGDEPARAGGEPGASIEGASAAALAAAVASPWGSDVPFCARTLPRTVVADADGISCASGEAGEAVTVAHVVITAFERRAADSAAVGARGGAPELRTAAWLQTAGEAAAHAVAAALR
jgi:hypothetical protein